MSGFTPWRGTRGPAPTAPAEPVDELTRLREANRQLRNDKAAVESELRDTKRERNRYQRERDSARLMLAAAKRHCEAGCMHAKANVELVHTLHAQERVIAELQVVNEGYESHGFAPRPVPGVYPQQFGGDGSILPKQRQRTT